MILFEIALASFLAGALNPLTGSFGGALLMLSFTMLLGTEDAIAIVPFIYLAIGWDFFKLFFENRKYEKVAVQKIAVQKSTFQKITPNRNSLWLPSVSLILGSLVGVWLFDTLFKQPYILSNVISLKDTVAVGFLLFGLHNIFYSYFEAKPKLHESVILNSLVSLVASAVSACIGFFEQPILEIIYDRTYSQKRKDELICFSCYVIAIMKCGLFLYNNTFYKGLLEYAAVGIITGFCGAMFGRKYKYAIYHNSTLKLLFSAVFVVAAIKLFWF